MGQSPPSETYNNNGEGLPFFQGKAEFGVIKNSLFGSAQKLLDGLVIQDVQMMKEQQAYLNHPENEVTNLIQL